MFLPKPQSVNCNLEGARQRVWSPKINTFYILSPHRGCWLVNWRNKIFCCFLLRPLTYPSELHAAPYMAPPTALLYWIVITGSIKSAACYGSQGGNRRPAIVSFRGRYLAQQQTEGSQKGGASHLCVLYLWRTSGEMGNFSRQKTSDLQDSSFLPLDLDGRKAAASRRTSCCSVLFSVLKRCEI